MARIVSPLLLFLVLSNGSAPSLTLAQNSNADQIVKIVKEGEKQVINTTAIQGHAGSMCMFVKPESAFQGLLLDVQGSDAGHYTAWFPAEDECFPHTGKYHKFEAMTWMNDERTGLVLGFGIGTTCRKECMTASVPQSLHNLSVVAYGPSRWSTGRPSAPTTNWLLLAVAVVVIVVAVVVVVVLVVRRKRHQQLTTSSEVRFESQPHKQSQVTLGQGHTPAQDEPIYDEIVFIDKTRPPAQHPDELIYDDVAAPHPPLYENLNPIYDDVAPPTACLGHPGLRESNLYATVL